MNGRRNLTTESRSSTCVWAATSREAPYHQSFGMLTDRRNLVLAVNTADMPGNEVRMWYNPDEMENRQRAVFMARKPDPRHGPHHLASKTVPRPGTGRPQGISCGPLRTRIRNNAMEQSEKKSKPP